MASYTDEDKLEGDMGFAKRIKHGGASPHPMSAAKGAEKRQRAAWYNRRRGAGGVKLANERPPGSQRVIVKIKPVRHGPDDGDGRRGGGGGGGSGGGGGGRAASLMRHALYVERDGAGRDGQGVDVFDRDLDRADGKEFVERCEDDRHHFRVIISPEYGDEFPDLKSYTRELVSRVETDLKTRLQWIAAEHHDTGRPHIHLLIRGVRDDGRDLVMSRQYISHTFRERAEELATRELGPRRERDPELDQSLKRSIDAQRLTRLDGVLVDRAQDHEVSLDRLPKEAVEHAALVRRLNRLEEMRLAQRVAADRWRLDHDLEKKLQRMGEARERERATAKLLAKDGRDIETARTRLLEEAHSKHRIAGRLVGFEKMGSRQDAPYLLGVEGVDGKFWTARVSRLEELRILNDVPRGAIVELSQAMPGLRASDQKILEIAGSERVYSAELHHERVRTDRETFVEMHVRRLEALRMDGIVERDANGVFHLPADYEARVIQREGRGRETACVELLDRNPIKVQEIYRGPTLLDQVGENMSYAQVRDEGFGRELMDAVERRQQLLREQGLGRGQGPSFKLNEGAEKRLVEMERDQLRQQVERDTGRAAFFAQNRDRVEGVFVGRVHGARESFAIIEKGNYSKLVPWRPQMDRAFGQQVAGQMRGRDFDFKYGKGIKLGKGLGIEL